MPEEQQPAAVSPTTGQQPQSTNPISNAFNNAISNPASTAINAAVGFIPGVGLVNTGLGIANMFGAGLPTAGSLATGTYGKAASPTGMPGVIDMTTPAPNIGPAKADATLSNIADKGDNAVIGVGPYGPYTQADVNAMANMMAGEAGNQGVKGMAAVGAVAGNRAIANYNNYGQSIQSQLSKPGQFLGYNNSNANSIMKGTDPQSKALAGQALSTAQGVLSGGIPSPVGTATDFNKSPLGAKGASNVQSLGAHTFFNAPPNVPGQTTRDQAVQKALDQLQQQQQQQQQQDAQAPAGVSGQAKSDGTIGGEAGAFGAAPSQSPSGQASEDGTIGGETGAFGAAPSPGLSDAAKGDMSVAGETGTFGAPPNQTGVSIADPTSLSPAMQDALDKANEQAEQPEAPAPDLVSQLDMGPAFGLSLGPIGDKSDLSGQQFASLNTGTMTDATEEGLTNGQTDSGLGAGLGDGTIGGETGSFGAGIGGVSGGVGDGTIGGETGSFGAGFGDGSIGDGSIGGESYGGGAWGGSDTSSNDSGGYGDGSSSDSGGDGSSGNGGGDGGGGDGGGDGGGEKRGGFITPRPDRRIVHHALHALHRASGGMTDSPELRARLRDLGSQAYDYGHGSFSPDESREYNNLTNYYNFPRHVGSGHMTREDEDAAMLQHLQGNMSRERLEGSYADGGIVDKALEAVGGQQANPVAMAKDVATAPAARQLSPLGLYSQGAEVAANLPQAKGSPQQMKAMLTGVKKEELGGYDDAFADKKSVTKDEIAEHFRNQMPQVEERVLHSDDGDTKFGTEDLTLPGGENYREVLLKSPVASAPVVDKKGGSHGFTDPTGRRRDYWSQQEAEQAAKSFYRGSGDFKSSHWDDPNVLAHLRMSDRTGPNGEKILHIEEIQSDWAQEGRELRDAEVKRVMKEKGLKKPEASKLVDPNFGFAQASTKTMAGQAEPDGSGNYKVVWEDGSFSGGLSKEAAENRAAQGKANARVGVPTGPYVTSTPAWTDLALKRALKEAAEGGYDKIVWTPGAEHAKRYDLSKKVDRIAYDPEEREFSYVQKGVNGWQTHPENVDPEDLPGIIGRDAADQLLAQEVAPLSGNHVMESSDLIIGDKGMKGYYDNIVPKRLQELVKKHDPDARVGAHEIPNSGETRRKGYADVGEIMNWHPSYTNLSRQEQSARWNEMTPVHRRQLIKDYENSQSGDITGHGIDITPKMRESILKGQSAFKRGGSVSPEQAELQRRMQSILRPDSDDPEMVQKYLQARASYDMPTHERGAYSARVLPMAAHNVQTTIGPLGNAVPKQAQNMSWNAFHKLGKGGTLFTLGGDRSNLGRLTHINGKEMAWPVDLHAGTKYMAEPNPGAVWANAKGARTALRTNILEAAKKGPVYGAFAAMGPTAVDSANNMFDVLMAQVPGSGISKKDAEAFDNSLKRGDHIKGSAESDIKKREAAKKVMENWPGIQNAEKARDFAKTISGGHRGAIVKYMEAAPWQKAGFPSVGITRAAITDPELLDVSGNMMGHHVVELDPQTYNKANLAFHHSTYDYPTGGKLVGKLPFIERHVATPDFTEQQVMDKAVVKKTGEPLIIHPYSPNDQGRSSYRGNTEMRQAIQPINDRMLESIQEKHGTSFADGGKAKSKGDASIVKRALMLTSKKA
jgi:hypothetical protein